jgi:hypothetical protein
MLIAGQSACGDKKGAERSLQLANNRIKKVVAAGAAGAIVGGPVGAAEAAIPDGKLLLVAVTEKD